MPSLRVAATLSGPKQRSVGMQEMLPSVIGAGFQGGRMVSPQSRGQDRGTTDGGRLWLPLDGGCSWGRGVGVV